MGNYTQISTKTAAITGTNQEVKAAGRNNEMAYQMSLRALELRRDMESALCSSANGSGGAVSNATTTATHAGSAGAARYLRGLEGWIANNVDMGVGGVAPVYTMGSWAAPTDGTQRAFTESQLKNVLQKIYAEGGDPDMIMVGASQKQTFSTFTGGSTRFDKAEDKSVTASVDRHLVLVQRCTNS